MKVSVEKNGPCRKTMTVELPVENVREEYDQMLRKSMSVARIPGFRPGRAPLKLVESHYGRMIREDVKDRMVARTYKEALKQVEIDPVMILDLKAELNKDQPLVYRLTMDVAPEFKLPRYKGIAIKAAKIEVTDEMVEDSMQRLLKEYATYVETDQPICQNDLAVVDFDAQIDGKPMSALGRETSGLDQGRDRMVMVSPQGAFLPGFDTELVGMKAGEEKNFEVTFPEKFTARCLAGKRAAYKVLVKKVRAHQAAKLDEALLKRLEAADEAQLRAKIREQLLEELQRNDKERLKEDIVRQLLEKTSLDLPESLARDETKRVFASMTRRLLMQGMPKEQITAMRDDMLKTAETTASERARSGYILHGIALEENIVVEDAELDQEIRGLAQRHRTDEDTMRKRLEKENELESVRYDILIGKTLDFLLANAKIGEEGFLSRLMGGGRRAAGETPAPAP